MGFMDIFGKGPLSEQKIAKLVKLACNPYAQPDVRVRELQRLLSDGSYEAICGALKRFSVNAHGSIADEDEKKWLEDALVETGRSVLEPIIAYIQSEKQLTYALRAYRRLAGKDAAIAVFIEVLQRHGPDAYREMDPKLQLIWQLSEHLDDPRVTTALIDFLGDHSDEIRSAVLDLINDAAEAGNLSDEGQEASCQKLAELVCDEDVSPRIQGRAADLLATREWAIPGQETSLASFLGDDYFLDKKRFVRRRARSTSRS